MILEVGRVSEETKGPIQPPQVLDGSPTQFKKAGT